MHQTSGRVTQQPNICHRSSVARGRTRPRANQPLHSHQRYSHSSSNGETVACKCKTAGAAGQVDRCGFSLTLSVEDPRGAAAFFRVKDDLLPFSGYWRAEPSARLAAAFISGSRASDALAVDFARCILYVPCIRVPHAMLCYWCSRIFFFFFPGGLIERGVWKWDDTFSLATWVLGEAALLRWLLVRLWRFSSLFRFWEYHKFCPCRWKWRERQIVWDVLTLNQRKSGFIRQVRCLSNVAGHGQTKDFTYIN